MKVSVSNSVLDELNGYKMSGQNIRCTRNDICLGRKVKISYKALEKTNERTLKILEHCDVVEIFPETLEETDMSIIEYFSQENNVRSRMFRRNTIKEITVILVLKISW